MARPGYLTCNYTHEACNVSFIGFYTDCFWQDSDPKIPMGVSQNCIAL